MRSLLAAAACLAALLAAAAPAAADTVTVDFETGPALDAAVTDDYLASASVQFLRADRGFRPYRRAAPGQARSGTVVADVGFDVCLREGDGGTCEFPVVGTTGRLARTASSVKVYAGLLRDHGAPVTAKLIAYRADGTVAAEGATVPIGAQGFTTEVSVTSAAADIARFELVTDAIGSTLGFDDLTLEYPTVSRAHISLGLPVQATVLQGKTTHIRLDVLRLNGSSGPVRISAANLPPGVVLPALTHEPFGATLHMTAKPDAPAFDEPVRITVTADPQGNADVAPGPRSQTMLLRVGENFALRPRGDPTAAVPTCVLTEVPFVLDSDIALDETITLTASNLPPGVSAGFLPGSEVPPGRALGSVHKLLLRAGAGGVPAPTKVEIRATSPGAPDRTLEIEIAAATPTASFFEGGAGGRTPAFRRLGDQIRLGGNGFCPGTTVRVGNGLAVADTEVDPDGRGLTFRMPRLATTGPVTVVPPGRPAYPTTNALTVRSFRNTFGMQFANFPFGTLSLDELTDLVGADDMFVKVNPCWPFGSCHVVTGFVDPGAFIVWGALNLALRQSGGHCFGFNRAVQRLMARKDPLSRFGPVSTPFEIPSAAGPSPDAVSYLDSQHAAQGTSEFLSAFATRKKTIEAQLDRLRGSVVFGGRSAGIVLRNGRFKGHAVLAYDIAEHTDGSVDIFVYDNETPFLPAEVGNAALHQQREIGGSVIHINAARDRWEFGGWSGGGDSIFTVPLDAIPDDPALAGVGELDDLARILIFGSANGAVRSVSASKGAELLPVLDRRATPGAAGSLVARRGARRVAHTVRGVRRGTYTQAISGPGFAAAATDVPTSPGVRDSVSGSGRGIRFQGGADRNLELQLAARSRAATIRTRTSGGGGETAALGSRLSYRHDGAPTSFSFTLTSVRTNGGPATFVSERLRIGRGERVTATPVSWGKLDRVRVTVGGRTRVLRNRAKPAARLSVGRPRVRGRSAAVRARFGKLPEHAAGGVVLRAVRGGRTVARRAIAVRRPRAGSRTFRWRMPKLARGRYRLVATVALSVSGERAGTVRRSRSSAFGR